MRFFPALSIKTLPQSGLFQSPVFLLLISGTLLGFNFPLGKIGGSAGISPMIWAWIVSLGASATLLPILIFKGRLILPKGRLIPYIILSSLITFVIPNILLYSVIPKVGSGFTGLMFALSPVFTLTLAMIFRLNTPNRTGLSGIILGFLGAIIVSLSHGTAPEAPHIIWFIIALLIPLTLAAGNIYRTKYWPDKASPDILAFWSHAFSVLTYSSLLFFTQSQIPLEEITYAPMAVLAQMLVAGMLYPFFFRLQQKGGPVLLSQIGYVAAAVSLIIATILLDEKYRTETWTGAAVIALAILMTIRAQFNHQKKL